MTLFLIMMLDKLTINQLSLTYSLN